MATIFHLLFILLVVQATLRVGAAELFVRKIILGPSIDDGASPSLDDGSNPSLDDGSNHSLDDGSSPLDDRTTDKVGLNETETPSSNGTLPLPDINEFFHGFVASVSVIVVSELGDKTFFIAVILAMNHPRALVFLGAAAALIIMTILSAGLGVVSSVIPRVYVHYISVALFLIFGLKMLKDGYYMTGKEAKEEYELTQQSIESRDSKLLKKSQSSMESGVPVRRRSVLLLWVFLEAFIMTFLAEWGDRSQLTTILLAARENASGVIVGAILGHVACTLLAILGGYVVAKKISVRIVTIIGGLLFMGFAIFAIISGPGSEEESTVSTDESTTIIPWTSS